MRKLLTRATLAWALMAVFSVYGGTSNAVFFADFNKTTEGQVMDTAADLNNATEESLRVGTWSLTAVHSARASSFLTGDPSQGMVLNFDSRTRSGDMVGTLDKVALIGGAGTVSFNFDMRVDKILAGVKQTLTAYAGNNAQVFVVEMSTDPATLYQTWVNGVPIAQAFYSTKSTDILNKFSLTLSSTGIDVTFTKGGPQTVPPTTNTVKNISSKGGTSISRFQVASGDTAVSRCDWDNFKIWTISNEPPPPRLDLFLLTNP
jgi:hypothetical protein